LGLYCRVGFRLGLQTEVRDVSVVLLLPQTTVTLGGNT